MKRITAEWLVAEIEREMNESGEGDTAVPSTLGRGWV